MRFRNVMLMPIEGAASFAGQEKWKLGGAPDWIDFQANIVLFLIGEAWKRGCALEDLADGFGAGEGTGGDWSAIRDSSPAAQERMFERALNHLFPERR